MVRGNHVLPNAHFQKWWRRYVKTWFNQPGRKQARRLARQRKVAGGQQTPLGLLRPVVHPPTQRYNLKLRFGKGFTLEELHEAKISKKVARTIGISVDHRRRNRCMESLTMNVDRLKVYKSRLSVAPKNRSALKKGFGGIPDDVTRSTVLHQIVKERKMKKIFPVPRKDIVTELRAITAQDRNSNAFETIQSIRKSMKSKKDEKMEA